jgi:hypothetical protein
MSKIRSALLFIAFVPFVFGGCVLPLVPLVLVGGGAAVGAGAVVYAKGELQQELKAPPRKVYNAAVATLKVRKYQIVNRDLVWKDAAGETSHASEDSVSSNENITITKAVVTARASDDEEVVVTVEAVGESKSLLRIRVGTFGDEALSSSLASEIRDRV